MLYSEHNLKLGEVMKYNNTLVHIIFWGLSCDNLGILYVIDEWQL